MPYTVVEFQATPNPNAVKCVLDHSPAPDRPRAYVAGEPTDRDPLAAALLALPGVRNLLIHDGWITVGKEPGTDWKPLRAAVELVLRAAD